MSIERIDTNKNWSIDTTEAINIWNVIFGLSDWELDELITQIEDDSWVNDYIQSLADSVEELLSSWKLTLNENSSKEEILLIQFYIKLFDDPNIKVDWVYSKDLVKQFYKGRIWLHENSEVEIDWLLKSLEPKLRQYWVDLLYVSKEEFDSKKPNILFQKKFDVLRPEDNERQRWLCVYKWMSLDDKILILDKCSKVFLWNSSNEFEIDVSSEAAIITDAYSKEIEWCEELKKLIEESAKVKKVNEKIPELVKKISEQINKDFWEIMWIIEDAITIWLPAAWIISQANKITTIAWRIAKHT